MKTFSLLLPMTLAAIAASSVYARAQDAPAPLPQMPPISQGWQPVPLVTAAQRADPTVQIGGEGAQWARALAWSRDEKLAIWGTDVGGLYRTRDGGQSWEPCNVGYTPRGTASVAIDPNNSQRIISIGANSMSGDMNGPYLSEDGAASWKQTLKANIAGSTDNREQIAFDPSTYDDATGLTRVVYWSRIAVADAKWGAPDIYPALYKSADGGASWAEVPGTTKIGGSILKVRPAGGAVYAANASGFYRSEDGGATWLQSFAGEVTGLDVSRAAPDSVWMSSASGVYFSANSGKTWKGLQGAEAVAETGSTLRNVHVSPANPAHLVLWRQQNDGWDWPRFASSDGGATWTKSEMDTKLSFLPTNARNGLFAWHPTDANILLSTGGDYPTISTDGGQTYAWTGDGVNNILSGKIQFNTQNLNVLFVSSQDYNGASTLDGGKTWTYQNPSGQGWGGFTYGGYAASDKVMIVGNASGWGTPGELTITRDGGQTWTKTGLKFSGADIALGAPDDANVLFASNLRSSNGGENWAPMDMGANSAGCDGVYTFNPQTAELWGVKGKDADTVIVASTDKGATWRAVKALAQITDIAVDPRDGRIWAVTDKLQVLDKGASAWRVVENLPTDMWGAPRVRSVALDPLDPNIIYLAANRDAFSTSVAAMRSTDGGVTWQNLTRQMALNGNGKDGGREAFWVRVNAQTREAWFVTSCYGLWKWHAPQN